MAVCLSAYRRWLPDRPARGVPAAEGVSQPEKAKKEAEETQGLAPHPHASLLLALHWVVVFVSIVGAAGRSRD